MGATELVAAREEAGFERIFRRALRNENARKICGRFVCFTQQILPKS